MLAPFSNTGQGSGGITEELSLASIRWLIVLLGLCAAPFASVVVSFTAALCMCAFDTFYVEN
jgi:hypothetical protein